MHCPNCGTQVESSARFCGNCGHQLQTQASDAVTTGGAAPGAMLPSNVAPSNARPANLMQAQPQVLVIRAGKSAGLAAILSFLWCGLGQIYNGQIAKGVIFGVIYFLSALAIFIMIGLITTPILWIWGMVDTYRTSERLNQEAGLM